MLADLFHTRAYRIFLFSLLCCMRPLSWLCSLLLANTTYHSPHGHQILLIVGWLLTFSAIIYVLLIVPESVPPNARLAQNLAVFSRFAYIAAWKNIHRYTNWIILYIIIFLVSLLTGAWYNAIVPMSYDYLEVDNAQHVLNHFIFLHMTQCGILLLGAPLLSFYLREFSFSLIILLSILPSIIITIMLLSGVNVSHLMFDFFMIAIGCSALVYPVAAGQ